MRDGVLQKKKGGRRMAAQWYVAQVASGKEASTARLCERFVGTPVCEACFAPECEVMWKTGGQWELKRKLLFPGYLFFVTKDVDALNDELRKIPAMARLLGAPPGYLGHDEGGQLTEAVRRRPYSVVLFDEIEKAHPDIQNVLLQMLEDGQLTDSMGRKADFRNTIVLLTSNLGARFLAGQSAPLGFGAGSEAAFEKQSEAAVAEAKKWFRPELVGRLDELIVFRPLEEQSLCSIAEKLLGQLEERAARSGYQLTHTARVGPALAAKAHSPYGARELRRQVDRAVEQAFADQIASGSVSLGQHWTADCAEDGTIVVQETQTAGVG